jgi:hypothetical protein
MSQNNYNLFKEIKEKMESNDISESRKSLQKYHEKLRKDAGLPDPSYYLELIKKKKKEIEELNKEIEMYEKMKNSKLKEDLVDSSKIALEADDQKHMMKNKMGSTKNDKGRFVQK